MAGTGVRETHVDLGRLQRPRKRPERKPYALVRRAASTPKSHLTVLSEPSDLQPFAPGSLEDDSTQRTVVGLKLDAPRVVELAREVATLSADVERLEAALCDQELYIVDGYLVTVWPVGDGTFIGRCPTLHAVVQEASAGAALPALREAMGVVRDGHEKLGRPLPQKDVVTRCLA